MKKEVTDADNIEKAYVKICGYGDKIENIAEVLEHWVYMKTVKNEFRMLPNVALRNKG